MFGTVSAEIGKGSEIHHLRYLRERQTFVVEILFQNRHGTAVDIGGDAIAGHAFDSGREVFGRHVQSFGIVVHVALRFADTRGEQSHELFHDVGRALGMRATAVALGMRLKDVVHHRQTEAAHQFAIELQMPLAHAVAKPMEVIQQMPSLLIRQLDDWVLVQRYTAADAIVVGRQQALQELIVSGKPLHSHIIRSGKVADAVGPQYHYQVVLHDMIAPFVEHETAFPCSTHQVHARVVQFLGIHSVEVGRIEKICLHGAKVHIIL